MASCSWGIQLPYLVLSLDMKSPTFIFANLLQGDFENLVAVELRYNGA